MPHLLGSFDDRRRELRAHKAQRRRVIVEHLGRVLVVLPKHAMLQPQKQNVGDTERKACQCHMSK